MPILSLHYAKFYSDECVKNQAFVLLNILFIDDCFLFKIIFKKKEVVLMPETLFINEGRKRLPE